MTERQPGWPQAITQLGITLRPWNSPPPVQRQPAQRASHPCALYREQRVVCCIPAGHRSRLHNCIPIGATGHPSLRNGGTKTQLIIVDCPFTGSTADWPPAIPFGYMLSCCYSGQSICALGSIYFLRASVATK